MRCRTTCLALAALALLGFVSVGQASLTSVPLMNDTDGVITCTAVWNGSQGDAAAVDIDGVHHKTLEDGVVGHVIGDILTNDPDDPTLLIRTMMDNDTGFAWTDYHLNVSMQVPFTILDVAGVSPKVNSPSGWSGIISSQPTLQGGKYVGRIDYYAGTPVDIGETLDLQYKISFTGSTSYSFCQEMIPTPEPATFVLLAFAMLAVMFHWRRRK